MPTRATEPAFAKINLYLHVLGRRDDGYHDLQSLVVFADIGDTVIVADAPCWSLHVDGTFGEDLSAEAPDDNLVLRAARRLLAGSDRAIALELAKNLPVGAGLGGGSADAAAALRALSRLHGLDYGPPERWADLGADIPVCLGSRSTLVEGMGERLQQVANLPPMHAVLVNPGEPSSTGAVFQSLAGRYGAPHASPLPSAGESRDPVAFAAWLAGARNDMTRAAIERTPVIGETLAALAAAPGVLLARMSGSGATCFGLFANAEAAGEASHWLSERAPSWWVRKTVLAGQ